MQPAAVESLEGSGPGLSSGGADALGGAVRELSLGVVGLDSSHVPEFSKRISGRQAAGLSRCRVTRYWTDGRHDMPASEVDKWRATTEQLGVQPAASMEAMLDAVDGVLVLSVNGARHEEQALAALQRGLPTYIDKPLANDLASARRILDAARKGNAPCYSASSLRFATELAKVPHDTLGDIVAIDAFGPGELNDAMPRLLFYGVHTVEMVDALLGPGVAQVRAETGNDRDFIFLRYRDGKAGTLRLERKGCYDFGATLHGSKALHSFKVDFAPVYDRLVEGMTRFFEGGEPPAQLRDIVENIAVIEAAHTSIARGGAWIDVPVIE